MNVHVSLLLITLIIPASFNCWQSVACFENIEEQNDKAKNYFTPSYENVMKIREKTDNYIEEQQKNITADLQGSVDYIKENGKKVLDTWSYAPDLSAESLLENPDTVLSVPGIIRRNGYKCETHIIISQGYILNVHRIPHPKDRKRVPSNTVLLHHGLFASSADWILNGPGKGLAYVLADAGYDVWMANIRGNRYSREHAWLNTNSRSYWDFSWHDVAFHDVPNTIDYIIEKKGDGTKISYIGHSMGTTILFAMLSLRPEYNTILSAGFALAPIAFFTDLKSPIKSLAPMAGHLASVSMLENSYEFIPKQSSTSMIPSSCVDDSSNNAVCKNFAFYICGYNEKQFNKALLPVFLAHLGTGTSWKTIVHFSQEIINGGRFQQFDYGYYNNIKYYGRIEPPEYRLDNLTLPLKLFWSRNDFLSSEKDVRMIYDKLTIKPDMFLIQDQNFNHLDYLWAVDVPILLNDELLRSLHSIMGTQIASLLTRQLT